MKQILIILLLVLPTIVSGQKKIQNKTFLYGNVSHKIKGKVLLRYIENDPKTTKRIMQLFTDKGLNIISWHSLFMPGVKYNNEEYCDILKQNHISTILVFELTNVSIENSIYAKTSTETTINETSQDVKTASTASTTIGEIDDTKSITLKLEVFSVKDSFSRPFAVVMGEATYNLRFASTERSLIKAAARRIVNGLENECAFD